MADLKVDASLPADQQLAELIARTTLTRYPLDRYTFGIPTQANLADPPATLLDVEITGPYMSTRRHITYRRVDLTQTFRYQDIHVHVAEPPAHAAVIAALNALGLTQLVPAEVTLSTSVNPDDPTRYGGEIRARDGSLLYLGAFIISIQTGGA
jgi:hypothetical protein